jgi:phosphatidylglycerol:prolipoprotein diacylglycerol transferase
VDSFIAIGSVHVPVYSLIAAAGIMCSMAVGLRTASFSRIDPDAFWDLGVVSVVAAFLLSRLLLVAENLHTFVQFPIAVLELPALSAGGIIATFIVALWYLHRRRLPLLGALDAAAPCLALLNAFLALGHFAEGTRLGMPTSVAWAVNSSFGRVHPFELYLTFAWLLVFVLLFAAVRKSVRRGQTAFLGLILAGLTLFLTDFFRLPNQLYGTDLLDGTEWRGLEFIVLGGLLLAWREAVPDRSLTQEPGTAATHAL